MTLFLAVTNAIDFAPAIKNIRQNIGIRVCLQLTLWKQ